MYILFQIGLFIKEMGEKKTRDNEYAWHPHLVTDQSLGRETFRNKFLKVAQSSATIRSIKEWNGKEIYNSFVININKWPQICDKYVDHRNKLPHEEKHSNGRRLDTK